VVFVGVATGSRKQLEKLPGRWQKLCVRLSVFTLTDKKNDLDLTSEPDCRFNFIVSPFFGKLSDQPMLQSVSMQSIGNKMLSVSVFMKLPL
jgi:hypothetical protein